MDPDGLGSCASYSDSLISLSYLMAVFSTKSFILFWIAAHMRGNTLVGTSPAKRDDPSAISQDFFLLCCQERGYQRRFHPNAGVKQQQVTL